jgi:hypothetical protein
MTNTNETYRYVEHLHTHPFVILGYTTGYTKCQGFILIEPLQVLHVIPENEMIKTVPKRYKFY